MAAIKNMGDLRVFLSETMQSVRDGTVDVAKAAQVAKLAQQINGSIQAEIAAMMYLSSGKGGKELNQLLITGETASPKLESEETLNQKVKRLKKEGKTLGQIQAIINANSLSEKKEISNIFLGIGA